MLSAICLVQMILTDFYHRRVSLYWMIAFGGLQVFGGEMQNHIINSFIVTFMLCSSWCYLKIKNRKIDFGNYLGEGDVLFLFCLTPILSPQLFVRFLIIGLLLSLLYSTRKIPLVTTLGTLYLTLFFYEEILPNSTSFLSLFLR